MSKDWVQDINDMHTKFGVRKWVNEQIQFGEKEKLEKFLEWFQESFFKLLVKHGQRTGCKRITP